MATKQASWQRVSHRFVCPVCGKPDWCTYLVKDQELAVHCMRIESPYQIKSGGWTHWVHERHAKPLFPKYPSKISYHKKPAQRWGEQAKLYAMGSKPRLEQLAEELGVAAWALEALGCGWTGKSYSIPERDHEGRVIGISLRTPDGTKSARPGSKRGLVYCGEALDLPGPLMIVEGASDTATALTLGFPAIGRPSNVGGGEALAALLPRLKQEVIVVVGENDRKRSEDLPSTARHWHARHCDGCQFCWPGKYGAYRLYHELKAALPKRRIMVRFPSRAKDLRGWWNLVSSEVSAVEAARRIREAWQ